MSTCSSGFLALVLLALATLGCEETEKTTPVHVTTSSPLVALTPTEFNNTVRDLGPIPEAGAHTDDIKKEFSA